ncbi:TPA: hypothetical protein QCU33_005644 [Bacillus cereus]|nr:hypothetical protein [Bacillus cereus]
MKDVYEIAAERVSDVCAIPVDKVMEELGINPNSVIELMDEIEEDF